MLRTIPTQENNSWVLYYTWWWPFFVRNLCRDDTKQVSLMHLLRYIYIITEALSASRRRKEIDGGETRGGKEEKWKSGKAEKGDANGGKIDALRDRICGISFEIQIGNRALAFGASRSCAETKYRVRERFTSWKSVTLCCRESDRFPRIRYALSWTWKINDRLNQHSKSNAPRFFKGRFGWRRNVNQVEKS